MKNTYSFLCLFFLLLLSCTQFVLTQNPKFPVGSTEDQTQNISVTNINFDDIVFSVDNSIPIAPNRYAGVTFYAVGTQTWLTRFNSFSWPNSLIVGYTSVFDYNIYSVNNLVIDFTVASRDVSFWWGADGTYSTGAIEIYNDNLQLVTTIPVNLPSYWHNFSLSQYSQSIKRVILYRPYVANSLYGHIYLENFQFTPIPDVQSVVFEPVTNQVINGVLTSSEIDHPNYSGSPQRIFPDRKFPTDTTNRKTVRVKAIVGEPNITVYFKNFDVDDPTSDSAIDENGANGNDNREGRTIGQSYPPGAAGVLSATSAVTNANGEAIVYFSVTKQPGDNFVVAASTNQTYLNGVVINGTGLKDSTNNNLPTAKAKRTEQLTVWRKLYMEVDSMGTVANNFVIGYIRGKGKKVGTAPVWVEVYPSTGPPVNTYYLEDKSYGETLAPDGTRLSYGGRMVVGGVHDLKVLDNRVVPRGSGVTPKSEVKVVSLNGNIFLHPNHPFKLYDDDDYNDSDGSQKDGDNGENVDALFDTFSKMQSSDDINQNAFSSAYIVPEYNWASSQNLNNPNVTFDLYSPCTFPQCAQQRQVINANRGSLALERDDFWVGYLLTSYQADEFKDGDSEGYLGGAAPLRDDSVRDNVDVFNPSAGVPPGGIGAVIFIEGIRDRNITPLLPQQEQFTFVRTRTAAHEVGHQFGLGHNGLAITGGLMSNAGNLYLTNNHINLIRWRIKSPGEGN